MIIGVSGYGYSGSGAVVDYLKEREDCDHIDIEFALPYLPHGLQDLEYHLTEGISRYYSCDAAIKDFLALIKKLDSPKSLYRLNMGDSFYKETEKFVTDISQVIWSGWWSNDAFRTGFLRKTWRFRILRRFILAWERYHKEKHPLPKSDVMYLSIMPENFLKRAKEYVNFLIDGFGCDRSKVTVINQPFEPNAPERSMRYFDDPKAIIVDRDPRDVYLFAKLVARHNASFIPTDNVEDFVKYHRLCRINSGKEDPNMVLRLSFEDMVYNYENTVKKINSFVQLPHQSPIKKYFDPDKSINNTQIYLKHPELRSDIEFIERELPEYLYPFDQYEGIRGSGNPFVCDSD